MSEGSCVDGVDPPGDRILRLRWLSQFVLISKETLRRHFDDTLRTAGYEDVDLPAYSEALTAMEWAVDVFVQCLREERSFQVSELARFRRLGTEQARHGMQLENLRAAFRRGVERCSIEFSNVAFEAPHAESGRVLTGMILRELVPLADAAEKALAAGYCEARACSEGGGDSLLDDLNGGCDRFGLTAQELRVLGLLPGHTNRLIAAELCISTETVKTHVARILRKLGARDRAHAYAIGQSHGLLPEVSAHETGRAWPNSESNHPIG